MIKVNTKLAAAAMLSAALLAGCGGGGGGGGGSAANGSNQTIPSESVVAFIQQLFATYGENSDPIDINSLTLATDDTVEPVPIV